MSAIGRQLHLFPHMGAFSSFISYRQLSSRQTGSMGLGGTRPPPEDNQLVT